MPRSLTRDTNLTDPATPSGYLSDDDDNPFSDDGDSYPDHHTWESNKQAIMSLFLSSVDQCGHPSSSPDQDDVISLTASVEASSLQTANVEQAGE